MRVVSMAEDSRKLFVAGLPESISEDVLRQLFEAAGGGVVEVSLPKDRATGRTRGFGFVTLATAEDANKARQALDGTFQAGKSISVRPFQAEPPGRREPRPMGSAPGPHTGAVPSVGGPGGSSPDRTLYMGNLPYDATLEEVEGLLAPVGPGQVARVNLPIDQDGRKRGFGFIYMASADAARQAIEVLKGAEIRGRRLVVNLAHPKGERPPREERSHGSHGGGGGGFGGGFGGFASPGGGGGGAGGAPPPPHQQRKTFDDRRRRTSFDGDGPPSGGTGGNAAGGGRRGRWERDRRGREDDDWGED